MTSPDAYPQALRTAQPFDIAGAKERLAAGAGGYEVVHHSAGLRDRGLRARRPGAGQAAAARGRRGLRRARGQGHARGRKTSESSFEKGTRSSCRPAPSTASSATSSSAFSSIFEKNASMSAPSAMTGTLSAEELRPDRRLLARGELPLGRPDLPARQPAPARAAAARAHQAAAARPLRHDAGPQPDLRAPEPAIRAARSERDLHRRARPRRPRPRRERLPRRHLHASSTRTSAADEDGLRELFRQFSFPGGIPSHVAPETPGLDP